MLAVGTFWFSLMAINPQLIYSTIMSSKKNGPKIYLEKKIPKKILILSESSYYTLGWSGVDYFYGFLELLLV